MVVHIHVSPNCGEPFQRLPQTVKVEEQLTVGALLESLLSGYFPVGKGIAEHLNRYSVLVNGRNILYLQNFATPLRDNDRIVILPLLVGG